MKASGDEPLADFLFNIREGHCEYFSTAMAIMLRTQGIATRIVNGFQQGDFNETAGVYVVKQRDAHSWVEVYFPETDSWVTFDPTPSERQFSSTASTTLAGKIVGLFGCIRGVLDSVFCELRFARATLAFSVSPKIVFQNTRTLESSWVSSCAETASVLVAESSW